MLPDGDIKIPGSCFLFPEQLECKRSKIYLLEDETMKVKQFQKKLRLNKQTVAGLNESQMENLKGGLTGDTCTEGPRSCPCYESWAYENCPMTSNPAIYPTLCATIGDVCC
jgi:natural product precursor